MEMTIAEKYRIPHSEFLSWDQVDRDKAIWWHIRQVETCDNCGTREIEWDPERGGNRHAYGAEIRRCRGCEVKEMVASSEEARAGRGVYIAMRKNENPYGTG